MCSRPQMFCLIYIFFMMIILSRRYKAAILGLLNQSKWFGRLLSESASIWMLWKYQHILLKLSCLKRTWWRCSICVSTPTKRHTPRAYYFQATFNVRKFDLGGFSYNISDTVLQNFVHASSLRPVSIMLTKDYNEKQSSMNLFYERKLNKKKIW